VPRVKLGTNDFYDVPFPVVVGDRYFHVYTAADGSMKIDVFRWDPANGTATYEVAASEPIDSAAASNRRGVVTFTQEDGGFLFKFRPDPDRAQLFGTVPGPQDLSVRFRDYDVVVFRGGDLVATFQSNMFVNLPIGIEVADDGSIRIGVASLPPGMDVERHPPEQPRPPIRLAGA
jgi:hypothetical protein